MLLEHLTASPVTDERATTLYLRYLDLILAGLRTSTTDAAYFLQSPAPDWAELSELWNASEGGAPRSDNGRSAPALLLPPFCAFSFSLRDRPDPRRMGRAGENFFPLTPRPSDAMLHHAASTTCDEPHDHVPFPGLHLMVDTRGAWLRWRPGCSPSEPGDGAPGDLADATTASCCRKRSTRARLAMNVSKVSRLALG